MAKKKASSAGAASIPAPKNRVRKNEEFEGGKILKGIWHNNKTYNPGDEAAFAATKPSQESLQMLANKGVIEGFGVEKEDLYEEKSSEEADESADEE